MATRAALGRQLRRARIIVGAVVVVVTGGLTAAVAGAIPGRAAVSPTVDPFAEHLTPFSPGSAGVAPRATDAPPVAVSGAS